MTPQQLPEIGIFYMASPYSKYAAGIWPAYREAARIAGRLVDAGLNIFSPIVHSHPLAAYGDIDPLNHALWMKADAPFCAMAGGLLVVQMDGWHESKGVLAEIEIFRAADKPIFYVCPQTLAIEAEPQQVAA
ncbi:DUF1937 family protein [Hyphomicrobium sp.]|uniref:DUF1937 family protein n=1 Tax=Hyphomicrobium sp. TaxID=82 RepID=UPI0025C15CDC|nr:DUF1937 family protein [Hyphomicrobium sp.]MCC7253837.1 DUF1937 family protein [Hyphomicrobium sp.]